MKTGIVACLALAMAGAGAAQAQSACGQIVQLALSNHAQVKAMRGDKVEDDCKETEYKFKPSVNQFETCRIWSTNEADSITSYFEHHLWCDTELSSSDQATKMVEELWACTKDTFTERAATEALFDGRYRITGFDAETPSAGRDEGRVDFGNQDYARVQVEKAYDTSSEVNLHVWWSF